MQDKYPHTRAFLSLLARDHSLSANYIDTSTSYSEESNGVNGDSTDVTPKVSLELVRRVVRLLEEEDEDGLKALLIQTYAISPSDPMIEQYVLDLMHKHKDDIQGVPFVFLAPTKRPISRPSSRASFRSAVARPDTPSAPQTSPSPLVRSLSLRRPHTPVTSPLSAGLHPSSGLPINITTITGTASSPNGSPVLTQINALPLLSTSTHSYLNSSQPSSPLSSPHFLNAKASEFKPASRPHSAMSGTFVPSAVAALGGRTDTPSPDLWAHHPTNPLAPGSPRKHSGNLAIASPLVPDAGYYPRPSSSLTRSNSGLRKSIPGDSLATDEAHQAFINSSRQFADPDDDDNDEFSPFSKGPTAPVLSRSSSLAAPTSSGLNSEWTMNRSQSFSLSSPDQEEPSQPYPYPTHLQFEDPEDMLSVTSATSHPLPPNFQGYDYSNHTPGDVGSIDGMTPFDVLHSVFGSTIAPATLEEALVKNGYDFESAMAWLIETNTNQGPLMNPPQQPRTGVVISGGRVQKESAVPSAGVVRNTLGQQWLGSQPNRAAVATGGRVCRYFLAGECRRSDCRFNHDVERALCRFWLKAQCAKGDQCEFLHALPQEVDISALTGSMAQTDLNGGGGIDSSFGGPAVDDFPALSAANRRGGVVGGRGGAVLDPSRTRFATALKKAPIPTRMGSVGPAVQRRLSPGGLDVRGTGVATPRPSPRLKLRPPSLLPTLSTGEIVNQLYLKYRSRAIQLGGERNICLTKAAEAWKRGDGASAKKFSKEAHELNAKMNTEANEAAGRLVAERAKSAMEAVRSRDTSWSDDPMDRSTRGKIGGDGLGVMLGVASASVGGVGVTGTSLTPEERTEVLLDLHGLHSNEAIEVLERFLLGLEKENFLGLAYVVVGEEKHTGTQDPGRGSSKARLAAGVKDWLHKWSYPWNERGGICCVDPQHHS